jgi:hypothetical protein
VSPMGQVTSATTAEHPTALQHAGVQRGDHRRRLQPVARADDRRRKSVVSASANEQFVELDGRLDLERAGSVTRLWCTVCEKHQVLEDDGVRTIEMARESHRCGPRTDQWDCEFQLGSGGST